MKNFIEHIIHEMSGTAAQGYGLAQQMDNGGVVVWGDNGEALPVTINDSNGNYFYIRTKDNNGFTERKENGYGGACNTKHRQTGAFRLVAVWRCIDTGQLIKYLKGLLFAAKNSYNGYSVKELNFTKVNDVWETIYKEEIRSEVRRFSPGLQLVSIDFKLSFVYDICNIKTDKPC